MHCSAPPYQQNCTRSQTQTAHPTNQPTNQPNQPTNQPTPKRSHPTEGGPSYVGVQVNYRPTTGQPYPSVHAPWYGYLLFTHATQGADLRFVRADPEAAISDCGASIKVYALTGTDVPSLSQTGKTVRLVAINKDLERACRVVVTVEGSWGDGLAVWLLPGAKGLMSKTGITWRAQAYEGTNDGRIAGQPLMQQFRSANVARGAGGSGGWTQYSVERLGPGQAVVVSAAAVK